jgi:predicted nucleotidyltransferase component of viral defense system
MDLREIRRNIIVALASNDTLRDLLVLKGGNALDLVYLAGARGSLDIDYSMAGDLSDMDSFRELLLGTLRRHFLALGLLVFDDTLEPKPQSSQKARWGGYEVRFKLIRCDHASAVGLELERLRRESLQSGPGQQRVFIVQISKYEFCDASTVVELGGAVVRIYTPMMIVAEKLRAICQQMPEYTLRRQPSPRARDFFDICKLLDLMGTRIEITSLAGLVRAVFDAKEVSTALLSRIGEQYHFHESDWAVVQTTARGHVEEFEHYFHRVVRLADELDLSGVV